MKYIKVILLFLFCWVININVYALSTSDSYYLGANQFSTAPFVYEHYSRSEYGKGIFAIPLHYYQLYNKNQGTVGYYILPYGNNQYISSYGQVGNKISVDNSLDAGYLYLLTNGYNLNNTTSGDLSGKDYYYATSIAIYMYSMLMNKGNTIGDIYNSYYTNYTNAQMELSFLDAGLIGVSEPNLFYKYSKVMYNLDKNIYPYDLDKDEDPIVKECQNKYASFSDENRVLGYCRHLELGTNYYNHYNVKINGSSSFPLDFDCNMNSSDSCKKVSKIPLSYYIDPKTGTNISTEIRNLSYDLLKGAITAYYNTLLDYKLINTNLTYIETKNSSLDDNYYNADMYYYFDVTNFADDGIITALNLNSTDENVKLSYNVEGQDGNYTEINNNDYGYNLVKLAKDSKTNTIWIKVHGKTSKTKNECNEDGDFTITYKYKDKSVSAEGYYNSASTMLLAISTNNYIDGSVAGSFESCGSCETTINLPSDCNNKETANEETIDGSIYAPTNVTKCILKQNDDAGNTYQYNDPDGLVSSTSFSNPYCSIYCKEDYTSVKLSGLKHVESGRYFQLSGHISGTKTCYTTSETFSTETYNNDTTVQNSIVTKTKNSIDIEKYNIDIDLAQKRLINAFNQYELYYTAKNSIGNAIFHPTSGCCGSGGYYTLDVISNLTYDEKLNITNSLTTGYQSSGGCSCSSCNCDKDGNCSCCGGCSTGSVSEISSAIERDLSNATTELNNAKDHFKKVMANINNCVSWSNDYSINAELTFKYDESYIDLVGSSQKLNGTVSTVKTCDSSIINDDCTKEKSAYYCSGNNVTIDNEYNNCTGSDKQIINDPQYEENVIKNDSTLKHYAYCDESGCKKNDYYISNARFIKKSISSAVDYTTPNTFYNVFASGTVQAKKDSSNTNGVDENQIDGYPVSLKTAKKMYNYSIDITGLGEYFNNHNYGRISNGKDAEHTVVKAVADKDKSIFNGQYVCHYIVNCPTCNINCEDKNETNTNLTSLSSTIVGWIGSNDGKLTGTSVTSNMKLSGLTGQNLTNFRLKEIHPYDFNNAQSTGSSDTNGQDLNVTWRDYITQYFDYGIKSYDDFETHSLKNNDFTTEAKVYRIGTEYFISVTVHFMNGIPSDAQSISLLSAGQVIYLVPYTFTVEYDTISGSSSTTCTVDLTPDSVPSLYDKGLQLNFRSISSTNINPNNRTLGYNWSTFNIATTYGVINSKAGDTINEIESSGESVYNQDPILTVNMTPNLASEIRSYNSTQNNDGGYGNDTLTCYDDNTYKNIFCYSQFLDDYSSKYPNAFIFTTTRLGSTENRKIDTASSGYWTTYSKFTGYTLGNYGGPSWK